VNTKNKFEGSLHSLYEQGQAALYIQCMADRLCEATLNGWISEKEYAEMLKQIMVDGKMLIQTELNRAREDTEQAK
jgi:hypothetical protein